MSRFEGQGIIRSDSNASGMRGSPPPKDHGKPRRVFGKPMRMLAAGMAAVLYAGLGLTAALPAQAATVGQGFAVTPSDLAYILKQIKIAEAHVANTTSATGPCGALVGTGTNQIASPLLSLGLRTVDGSCNNLQPGQDQFGAADQVFPRLATPVFSPADVTPAGFGPPNPTSYAQKQGLVFDSEPRTVSNLIVDQTSTNPAAIAAAGNPVRTQGNEGVVACTTDPSPTVPFGIPAGCIPSHETLFMPNVTTDVGLSPPYNSMFTLFGQFFDHGIDQTVKGGGTVFVPLQADDPLVAGPDHVFGNGDDLDPSLRFMVLTRGQNQPGVDGVLGTPDDVQDALNTDSPWVDQSQTYSSHASHQVFLREYVTEGGRPVATGKLLGGPAGPTAGGMATWATTKDQAANVLGLLLADKDVLNVPMLAADAYGKFIPGPLRGMPQYVTATGLVEGDTANPVSVPGDVLYFKTPFLTDIAHNAEPKAGLTPDANTTASADFAGQPAGTYDDEMLNAHFIAGDGRVNENIGLTAVHQVFHSEHDRLINNIENTLTNDTSARGVAALAEWKLASGAGGWNGDRLFQAARFVTEMEYQHLVFEEFARKVQPGINPFEPFAFTQTEINPAVTAEFAHAVYRFGHSMLTETISRTNAGKPGADGVFGTSDDVAGSQNDISLLDGFLNPPAYTDGGPDGQLTSEEAAGSVIMGMSDQVGNELDEFVTDTLRNNLLGLPLDLASINMTRARSEGVPRLNVFRRDLFNKTNDGALRPYTNWIDFGENLKHPESLINFVAAYGQFDTITSATTLDGKRDAARLIVSPDALAGEFSPDGAMDFMNSTGAWANSGTHSITGLDEVDLWVGGLAEMTTPFGGLLGTTFNYVFEKQMTDLQNGDRLYYLARTPGMNLRTQLEGNSFAELMMRNTNAHTLKADPFATADCKFELKNLAGTVAGFSASGNTVANDPQSECDETALLIRMPDGTIKYRARNAVDPAGINGQAVYNGTSGSDRAYGGNDNDTFWGGLGDDVIDGGGGADVALGGEGDDIITDFAGDDVPKGGPGNDAIDAGPGLDIIMGGEGKDFTNGGANANETFGGAGDDFIMLGESLDAAFGDGGDDWEEGGNQPDLMIGDSSNLFFLDDSQKPGNDFMIGQGGDDDYDMEGGDDIGVAGPGIEKNAGGSGYDWSTGQGDPQAQDADLALPIAPLDILQVGVRDKFNEVEALSGWKLNDILRGDDLVPSAVGGGGFIGCDVLDQAGVDRIAGFDALIPEFTTTLASVVALSAQGDCPILTGPNVWGSGNVLLGGGGGDLIEGRGADDIIDGDAYLSLRLSVRTNPNDAATEIGSASINGTNQSAMTSQYLSDGAGGLTGPTLQEAVFAGTVNPGNIVAVREILYGTGGVDTAQFSGLTSDYEVTTTGGDGTLGSAGSTTTVIDNRGTDGTDTLRNIERLQFSDTVAPGTPTVVAAVAGNGQATVDWVASLTGIPTSFSVKVLDSAGAQVGALRTAPGTAFNLVVTGLNNGSSYTFQVSATNAEGTSAFSASSNAVTPSAPVVQVVAGAPTIGTPVAGNAQVTVNWTAPAPVANQATITGYRVRTYEGTSATVFRTSLVADVSTVTITALTNGTGYSFDVAAINLVGTGAASARSEVVTPTAPVVQVVAGAPVIGTPVAGNASVTVNWAAPAAVANQAPITGYRIRTFIGAGATATGTTTVANVTSAVIGSLTNRTGYTFDVAAINSVGTGAASARSVAVTPRTEFVLPTVTARTPASGARSVSQTGNLTATFSEPVNGVNGTTFVLRRGTTVIAAVVSYNATTRVATLNPSVTLLTDRIYTATLSGIRDAAGNTMATSTWSFTTGPAPTITARTPAAGATGVRRNANVTATFSEDITGVSASTVVITRVSTGAVVASAAAFNATTNVLTINPSVTLTSNVQYRVTITGGNTSVRDLAGNPLVTSTWTFTTGTVL
ncbi:peroxidase family protein [Cryobacterium sp. TMT1-66-1]|uniref:peroxidase family protein n=1 Tax=Cryobacterium sp. TMT1-66-1 TaxID=1259242 RepID=UPI00106BD9A3|nr:peroxidase family protein [Cryobacterium sp. TMT1-66-1]TFD07678.1 heme peroxidase [Cryobacterium sp. TMT1-66-1]